MELKQALKYDTDVADQEMPFDFIQGGNVNGSCIEKGLHHPECLY